MTTVGSSSTSTISISGGQFYAGLPVSGSLVCHVQRRLRLED